MILIQVGQVTGKIHWLIITFPEKKPAKVWVCVCVYTPFSDTAMYHYLVGKIM